MRVLLVDDNPFFRTALKRCLEFEPDVEVAGEAENGQIAVERVRELSPDAVLMDLNMPVMNGIEATRLIHDRWPEIQVIGCSSTTAAEDLQLLLQAGAVGCISKTARLEQILETLRACADISLSHTPALY